MSYCVKCGVELDENIKKCPLCKTPVIKPYEDHTSDPMPYSSELYIPAKLGRRIIAFYVSIGLLIPNLILFAFALMFPVLGTFVRYVISTSLLFFFMVLFPLMQKKVYPYIIITIDFFALLTYLAFFAYIFDGKEWFAKIALPITCVFGGLSVIYLLWIKIKKRNWRQICAFLFTELGIFSMFMEFFLSKYYKLGYIVKFSIIIFLSCFAFAFFFLISDRNSRLQNWISKKVIV